MIAYNIGVCWASDARVKRRGVTSGECCRGGGRNSNWFPSPLPGRPRRLGPTGVGVGLALPSSGPAGIPGGGKPSPYGRKSREQSENVYENKGQAQKVAERLAAGPHRCRGRACPTLVGASRNAGDGKPSPYGRKSGEQSENVYENKGQAQKVAEQLAAGPHRCRGRACPTLVGASSNAGGRQAVPLRQKIEGTKRECL